MYLAFLGTFEDLFFNELSPIQAKLFAVLNSVVRNISNAFLLEYLILMAYYLVTF